MGAPTRAKLIPILLLLVCAAAAVAQQTGGYGVPGAGTGGGSCGSNNIPCTNTANTYSAAGQTMSGAGAASTPGLSVTGAPYTAGNATTNFPQTYLNQGAAVTTFSTAGTEFGINAPSGFVGHLINLFINGGSTRFRVDYLGNVFMAGANTVPAIFAGGTTFSVAGCGTATSLAGGSSGGKFVGGSATCTPVITMGGLTATNGWGCTLQDLTTATAAFRETAYTTTTVTFTAGGTVGATDTMVLSGCTGF